MAGRVPRRVGALRKRLTRLGAQWLPNPRMADDEALLPGPRGGERRRNKRDFPNERPDPDRVSPNPWLRERAGAEDDPDLPNHDERDHS